MLSIDLNCDMGEGFASDEAIMPFISSANIACGYHAGNAGLMKRTVELALQNGVVVGAHPAYPDTKNFGRTDMYESLKPEQLCDMLTEQMELLQKICTASGTTLHHVKPHGALYNRAAHDAAVSAIICRAVRAFDPFLLLYGLSGSAMAAQAAAYELHFVPEVFADRTYRDDGSLTPRSDPGALIDDEEQSLKQVLQMLQTGTLISTGGKTIPVKAGTLCIHGDHAHAAVLAPYLHRALKERGISIRAPFSAH